CHKKEMAWTGGFLTKWLVQRRNAIGNQYYFGRQHFLEVVKFWRAYCPNDICLSQQASLYQRKVEPLFKPFLLHTPWFQHTVGHHQPFVVHFVQDMPPATWKLPATMTNHHRVGRREIPFQ